MIKLDSKLVTSADERWSMALDALVGPMKAPEALQPKTSEPKPRAPRQHKPKQPLGFWAKAGRIVTKYIAPWINNRARDLALAAIVVAAFVGVFDGARYSATVFTFAGASIYAFALMPDALMILAGAKMRQVGITAAQHEAARSAMRFGLGFSLATNMIAALLRTCPWLIELSVTVAGHQVRPVWVVGAVAYHGVVVLILWHAFETLSKTRSDRKGAKGSSTIDPIGALASVATGAAKVLGRKASVAVVPAQRAGK